MKINRSPWIHQLDQTRQIDKIREDIKTDFTIVGAGIAGIATAFFLLKYTTKNVVVLEKSRVARGATGHNAGQVVSYFERPFPELVEEFGLKMACEGQKSIEMAWELLEEIYTECGLTIPFSRFTGYDGFSTFDQVIAHLRTNILRVQGGLPAQELLIADSAKFVSTLPAEYPALYKVVPHAEILTLLETNQKEFIAVSLHQKGVVNSALFSELVAVFLKQRYGSASGTSGGASGRFALFEETNISKVVLKDRNAILDAGNHTVTTDRVILCTNGFENLEMINKYGLDIDKKFHHLVNGVVGRMSGYIERMTKPPMAISYYVNAEPGTGEAGDASAGGVSFDNMSDPYFYLTRREYEYEMGKKDHSLICLGGPQHDIPDRSEYLYEFDYPEEVQRDIDKFAHKVYDIDSGKKIEYQFTWHGLMGYTPNKVRLIGEEPKNDVLLYNLGCNGVGILPSIYGARRIATMLSGEKVEPTMFDPRG